MIALMILAAATALGPEEMASAAQTKVIVCLSAKAQRLDDGISNADAVAVGIVSACEQQRFDLIQTLAHASGHSFDSMAKTADRLVFGWATEAVLEWRRTKRDMAVTAPSR